MCENCWIRAGSPKVDNEKVREATRLANEVYSYSLVGGDLHVQLDDWNLDDHFWDLEDLTLHNWAETGEQLQAEIVCLKAFKALTYEERASALALASGYWMHDA